MRIGLISDTHGLLRGVVHEVFRGVELILHAGDVGSNIILDELETIAPVHAVYGNTDDTDSMDLRFAIELSLEGSRIHVSHGHELGAPTPERLLAAYDADIIVYGHTHKQHVHKAGNKIVINPGAAGPRRFSLPASVAILTLKNGAAEVAFTDLSDDE